MDKKDKKNKLLKISRIEFLEIKPIRNPNLKVVVSKDGETIAILPRKKEEKSGFISKLLKIPDEKKIMLDEIGTFVINLCDGKHSVREIVEALHQKFKLNMEEAEAGLQIYLTQLSKRKIVGFILPDKMRENEEY